MKDDGGYTPVDRPRIGPFRSISRWLMPAIRKDGIGCPASGRSQRLTHEDENQRRPFLGPATPFCRMIPLCEETLFELTEEQDEGRSGKKGENEI